MLKFIVSHFLVYHKRGDIMNTKKQAETQSTTQFELSKEVLHNLYKYDLTPTTKLVLIYLVDCYNPENNKTVYPKIQTIADTIGLSEKAVRTSIHQLIGAGLILKTKKYNRNQYIFTTKITDTTGKNRPVQPVNFTGSYIEQIKEQKNQQKEIQKISDKDLELLKNHIATKKDIKYPDKYLQKVLQGDYKTLVQELNQAKNNNLYMLKSTKDCITAMHQAKTQAVPPTQHIKDVYKRLKAMV